MSKVNYLKINTHCLNDSSSKQLFSFTKSKRFNNIKKENKNTFYDINLNLIYSSKKAGIGYGKKYDFTNNKSHNKNLHCYNINRDKISGPKYSFGVSREKMEVSSINGLAKKNNTPCPGAYTLKTTKSNISYSFRIKPNSGILKNKKEKVNYNFYNLKSTFSKTGNNFNSKFKSTCGPKINPIKSKVNLTKTQGSSKWPYYDIKGEINKTGLHFNSKFKRSQNGKFYQSQRKFFKENENNTNPGPGQYILPSDFGVYISNKVKD